MLQGEALKVLRECFRSALLGDSQKSAPEPQAMLPRVPLLILSQGEVLSGALLKNQEKGGVFRRAGVLSRVAQEPNRNRKPEPSEPFFPGTETAEPEPPEPFFQEPKPEPEPSFPVKLY